MFSITPKANVAKIALKIKNLAQAEKAAIRKTFYEVGKDLVADARKAINQKPKHGRTYITKVGINGKILKRPRYYIASAPGEGPAVVTGKLRKSINFTVNGFNEMVFGVDFSIAGVDYGKYLEYSNLVGMSGQGSKNIKPRPFISYAHKQNEKKMMQKFVTAITAELRK